MILFRHPLKASRSIATTTLVVVFACTSRGAEPPSGMLVREYQPEQQDRFYTPGALPKAFIGDPYDFSGVARQAGDDSHWATLVSPTYVLSANHFAPGGSVRFFKTNSNSLADANGYVDRSIISAARVGSTDLWVGKLNSSVPSNVGVPFFTIAPNNEASLTGKQILPVGQSTNGSGQRVGTNNIDEFATFNFTDIGAINRAYTYDYSSLALGGADEARLVNFDSGGPTFSVINGQLALVGIHVALTGDEQGNITGSIDSFVPAYFSAIEQQMGGEHLTLVPEPAAAALLIVVPALLTRRRRRTSLTS